MRGGREFKEKFRKAKLMWNCHEERWEKKERLIKKITLDEWIVKG